MFHSWFSCISCCGFDDEKPRPSESTMRLGYGTERNIVLLRDQPAIIPRPSAEPLWSSEETYKRTLEQERQRERTRLRKSTTQESNSGRRTWFAKSPPSHRHLLISGPTDFRHLHSESFQLPPPAPEPAPRPRPRSFRPIELSIYQPHNRLSAILPHLERCDDSITPPPPAHTDSSSPWEGSSDATATNNEWSYSVMSFHYPNRHGRQGSSISGASMSPPRVPAKSDASSSPPRIPAKSRARALTAHNTEKIVERIASALVEKERLQAEINSLVERQSIYLNSRPSTSYTLRDTSLDHGHQTSTDRSGYEPMPSIPALPAAAPSFAERLSVDGRPQTAPGNMNSAMLQEKTLELAAMAAAQSPLGGSQLNSPSAGHEDPHSLDRPLAPPLPLVLRPPLRKKKSFSRVSSWLFHPEAQQQHQQHLQHLQQGGTSTADTSPTAVSGGTAPNNTYMVTTSPRPIKASDGFYQCVAPPEGLPRTSMETSSSVYTWETAGDTHNDNGDDDDARTVPTTVPAWSPDQTPKQGSKENTPVLGGGNGARARGNGGHAGGAGGAGLGVKGGVFKVLPILDDAGVRGGEGRGRENGEKGGVVVAENGDKGNAEGLGVVVGPPLPNGHRPLSVGVAF
ncbi:hypothetical protein VTK26DRAFT_5179 [Humicola hyalothermophila]